MLFTKSEGKPGQAWHQDETHIPTRDRSLTAVWIALDDATTENGCLWVIPGSHRAGVLYPDREQDDPRFDCTREAYGFRYREQDAVPVEVPAGTALVFDGYLLHRSLPNTGRHGMRRALVNHYMSAESLLPWFPPRDHEPMGTIDHRDILLVAGEDPYASRARPISCVPTSDPTEQAAVCADDHDSVTRGVGWVDPRELGTPDPIAVSHPGPSGWLNLRAYDKHGKLLDGKYIVVTMLDED